MDMALRMRKLYLDNIRTRFELNPESRELRWILGSKSEMLNVVAARTQLILIETGRMAGSGGNTDKMATIANRKGREKSHGLSRHRIYKPQSKVMHTTTIDTTTTTTTATRNAAA
jgi:hypothetical protein